MHPFLSRFEPGNDPLPGVDAWIDSLGGDFATLAELGETPQDPEWHGEGNVKVHTNLVLTELGRLFQPGGSGHHLSERDRLVLTLAAVFHDLGKIWNTREREIEGRLRIVSPRHPSKGRSWLALHHHPLELPADVLEDVLALIGHHHDPRRLVLDDAPEFAYRKLARLCPLELVYVLELADVRGRQAPDLEGELEMLELFRLQASEYGLWETRNPWADWKDHIDESLASESPAVRRLALAEGVRLAEAGQIFTPHEAVSLARQWMEPDREPGALVVLCGLSGSGKSSHAASDFPDHAVVSLDQWRQEIAGDSRNHHHEGRVLQAAREELRSHLRARRPVIWDATSLRKDQRGPVVQLGFNYHAHVEIVALSAPLAEIYRRNRSRTQPVPNAVLERQLARCEWPFASQAHGMSAPG